MAIQARRCSWKTILGLIGITQILLFAAFQGGFFAISKSPKVNVMEQFRYKPLNIPPKLSNFQDEYWTFEKQDNDLIKHEPNYDINSDVTGVDLRVADKELLHTFDIQSHLNQTKRLRSAVLKNSVAIGLAITSHKSKWSNIDEIRRTFPFFHTLLISFCNTASFNYSYNFFLAFDKNDKFFTDLDNLQIFQSIFYEYIRISCHPYSEYMIHFVQCSHNRHPAWAQNDAMIAAYMSNIEYFYRINDDTEMKSKQWTEIFIATLNTFDPPNVGVVGPTHKGGNMAILTYDFVHYTHIEIHGIYYPHMFTDWYADRWITDTYRPGRCIKVKFIHLLHTLEKGQRYSQKRKAKNTVKSTISSSKTLVERYVERQRKNKDVIADSRKVISMSLFGRDPVHTYGAIRNLQLHKSFLPEWTIRIYVLQPTDQIHFNLSIPDPVLEKLLVLGAKLVFLNESFVDVAPQLWRYLVIDDDSVDYFLIRETYGRLDERYEALVNDYLKEKTSYFCVRDFTESQKHSPITAGLLGADRKEFANSLGGNTMARIIRRLYTSNLVSTNHSIENENRVKVSIDFLENFLGPIYQSNAKCYDSSPKPKWKNSLPFPTAVPISSNQTLNAAFNQFEIEIKR